MNGPTNGDKVLIPRIHNQAIRSFLNIRLVKEYPNQKFDGERDFRNNNGIKISSLLKLPSSAKTSPTSAKCAKMRIIPTILEDPVKQHQLQQIYRQHQTFLNEKKNLYQNVYMNQMFKMLKNNDNDYYKKRNLMDINTKSSYMASTSKSMNTRNKDVDKDRSNVQLYLTAGLHQFQFPRMELNFEQLTNACQNNTEPNEEHTRLIDSFDSEYCQIDKDVIYNRGRIIKKLQMKYPFYSEERKTRLIDAVDFKNKIAHMYNEDNEEKNQKRKVISKFLKAPGVSADAIKKKGMKDKYKNKSSSCYKTKPPMHPLLSQARQIVESLKVPKANGNFKQRGSTFLRELKIS